MPYGTLNADTITNSNGLSGNAIGPGFKNRIINGDMRIDQRNAGASVSNLATTEQYTLDRWSIYGTSASKFTAQQSSTAPSNYTNSFLLTSSAATTPASGDAYGFRQKIEGYNVSDLSFGSATAATITLSFWVRSSIIGTYAIGLFNSAQNRSYVNTYTISVANTWEQKSVTITGDTSGTWLTTNGTGLDVWWDLGSGSGLNATAGVWNSSLKARTSSSSNWIGTNGATFYITGVQLEVAPSATSFDYRDYGRELILCQRYYEKSYNISVVPGTVTITDGWSFYFVATGATDGGRSCEWKVRKRAAPTVVVYSTLTGASGKINAAGTDINANISGTGEHSAFIFGSGSNMYWHTTATSEL